MNWFLGIVAASILGVCFFINIIFIQFYRHPEDKWVGWFPRLVIILGLLIAESLVLMLPFDIANVGDDTYPIVEMWNMLLYALIAFIVLIIPFAQYYYESMNAEGKASIMSGLCSAIMFLIIFCLFFFIGYIFLGKIELPVEYMTCAPKELTGDYSSQTLNTVDLEIDLSYPVFLAGMISFLGNIFLTIFGGIGLFTLPFSLINDYRKRPKSGVTTKFIQHRRTLSSRGQRLREIGVELRSQLELNDKPTRQQKKMFNRWKNAFEQLQAQNDITKLAFYKHGGSPIWFWFKGFLGILFFVISGFWYVHVLLYLFFKPAVHPFLNSFFIALDGFFPLLGIAAYALCALYLLWAVLHGVASVGLKVLFFTVHKMRKNDTTLNSILFNVWLLLITVFPIVQFCVKSFGDYSRVALVKTLVSVQIENIKYLKHTWSYFIIAFLGFGILTLALKLMCPGKSQDSELKDLDRVLSKDLGARL
ncbi:hypothetical protein PCE1_001955 [Barthelona sp. PCE]